MQRPVFITVRAPPGMTATGLETPYMVKIVPAARKSEYVPNTELLRDCGACNKPLPRIQMVHATKNWDGRSIKCKGCPRTPGAYPISRRALLGWVHDSVGPQGYVSAQIAGVVEDDSNASVTLN